MKEKIERVKRCLNLGSVLSGLALAAFFAAQALDANKLILTAVSLTGLGVSVGVLFAMIGLRQDGGKEAISYNRIFGQAALGVLMALAAAVALR